MYKMMVGIAALGALAAAQAHAGCNTRSGAYKYGQIYYVGNPFTSVAGGIGTSDKVFIFVNLNKCLAKNTTYKVTSGVISSIGASVGPTAINNAISLQYFKGGTVAAQGSFTTGAAPSEVVSWNISLTNQKKNATQFVGSANGANAEDVGNVTTSASHGFNNHTPGVWQLQ
jgi:hypothetical protein